MITQDQTKVIVSSSIASGLGPAQIVAHLGSQGVECYVTDQGDLAIKSWQIIKGFMPPADVPLLQQPPHPDADPLNWVSANLDVLRARYGGRWIAVTDRAVVADATTLPKLLGLIHRRGIEKPLVTQVPREEPTWTVTYVACHQDV